jgi:predicted nucleotidyltransferase
MANNDVPYSNAPLYNKIPEIPNLVLSSVPKEIVKKIYLFGSYSRGEADEDSDMDICVVVDNECDFRNKYGDISMEFSHNGLAHSDLLVIPEKYFGEFNYKDHINNIIKNEGVLLYG